jgi:hypothetical protein
MSMPDPPPSIVTSDVVFSAEVVVDVEDVVVAMGSRTVGAGLG